MCLASREGCRGSGESRQWRDVEVRLAVVFSVSGGGVVDVGVRLAWTVTIPKSKMEWYKVYSSVGTGLEKSLALENMRKILSFSYFDLPYHLRTCLLYLSMFPEDYKINKYRLIWMWMAEGFIKSREQGEGYFNELINRCMIQPIHNSYSGSVEHCCVHDMVLDLIRSLSSEENFVTILSDVDDTSPSIMARRFSLQNAKEGHDVTEATTSLQQKRSVAVFPSGIDLMPGIGRFRVLRVLDLQYCSLAQGHSLRYLGNLLHLRYLGLRCTGISQLPEEIGKLQSLQTLNLMQNQISGLPSTIVQLRNLMCLLTDKWTRMPKGIGNLACLEEVSKLSIDKSTMDNVGEIGQLTKLRVLHIALSKWNDMLANCLHNLKMIKHLCIEVSGQRSIGGLDDWRFSPQHIHALDTRRSCWFSRLPDWMNPSRVVKLSIVSIAMTELHEKDLEVLARLPALRTHELEVDHENLEDHQNFVFGAGCFPCLVRGKFLGFAWPVVFRRGTMPKLQDLIFSHSYASLVPNSRLSLGKLPSLKRIDIDFVSDCDRKEAVKQAKAARQLAAKKHPNLPALRI
ncbi:hypothetical protein HU200_048970 [Digitaria exilis]|uniref:NB-ARC domain-containing protein n=1 Tax=Digitaria exilis TaxID=1010633 RepID=A0A835ASB7_9POAL|nr:hypothetical protein HU200_048970 [Digitaria exilis]